ncbi:MAG: class I SAM-dependent methyltransferase [Acidobacteriaceae bacterium]|nr:class I SAM-dependent methyltransferase [Acidobacteriaceae bacterium]
MALNPASLERIIPEMLESAGTTGQPTLALHLSRYEFAARHMQPGRVLDIACGVGYGTKLLATRADSIRLAIGVDISADAIDYARARYAHDRIKFVEADALEFSDSVGFENIVSLETIEHVPDPHALLAHLVRLLRPNGTLIGSVPITPTVDVNPHHLTDFTAASFRRLGRRLGLLELDALIQDQVYDPVAVLTKKERRLTGMRGNLPAYYIANPGRLWARIYSTLRHGFKTRNLTLVWKKQPEKLAEDQL